MQLPDRGLTQTEVERLWARDRVNLRKCFDSFEALKTYVNDLARRFDQAKS